MKTIFVAVTALTLSLAAPALAQQTPDYGTQSVAYHINGNGGEESRAYYGALRNVQNHINAVGAENMEIAVVMHGNGLGLLQAAVDDTQLQTVISGLKEQGVRFEVCNNTLVGRDIDWENDLYDVWADDIVPSGVAQLSYLQAQGYTYIKP
ncbi:DsrE family protein [Roseobacter sp. HKCCA0434]|uniref:DsrE family protein n=1 Tax=Roseobacter sp. HKCCA0434 TaxID=3079297 RepID=UPI0029058016|nr:DsrE family protein [Roseobacter sp. HKCCA0434]